MKKRMLRSVLATAFVVALASGAAGSLGDVGWTAPVDETSAVAQDVGWVVQAAPGDVGWGATAETQDVGW
jgi:hypothetical protein